jgi:hypothetical protein
MTVFDARWQPVTCRECKRSYQCTPEDDYCGGDSATTGLCFSCLLAANGMDPEATPVRVIDLTGAGSDPRDLSRKPDGET